MGPWSEHGTSWYNCSRYEEKADSSKDAQSRSRAQLERYLFVRFFSALFLPAPSPRALRWRKRMLERSETSKLTTNVPLLRLLQYYNRFSNHEQSIKLEADLYARTEKKMEELQEQSNLSWIEVQFLAKAVETLGKVRTVLKWTYAMAFYLEKNNQTQMFEDNQKFVCPSPSLPPFPCFSSCSPSTPSTATSNKPSNPSPNSSSALWKKTRSPNFVNRRLTRRFTLRSGVGCCWMIR
jgi:hypothetical protein